MKLTVLTVPVTFLVFLCVSCSKNAHDMKVADLSFPYQEYLDSMGEDDIFPTIGDDGYGFSAISHKIRYPELSQVLASDLFADSLLQLYNTVLAVNTLAYDVSTADRYIVSDSHLVSEIADALDSINLSGIRNEKIKKSVVDICDFEVSCIRSGEYPSDSENNYNNVLNELYDSIYGSFLDYYLSDSEYSPSHVMADYDEIHARAIADTTTYREELLQKVLKEQNFEKKCILAREFAYANYKNPARDDYELVAVLDSILRSNRYSPLLEELWLMWRTALQRHIFGSPSNDSAMYNLFYNDMRNQVAVTYINHLAKNPDDKIAFLNFYRLTTDYNITRNSPCMFGNNSNLDEMYLYEEIWR